MEDRICLDTDFLVNFLRGKVEAVRALRVYEKYAILATTIINVFELFYGAFLKKDIKEISAVEELVDRVLILNLSKTSARIAGEIKAKLEGEGKSTDFRDVLIGSIALHEDYALKTENKRHFERIEGLRII